MLRFRWAVILPFVLISLLNSSPIACAEAVQFSVGIKIQYIALTRTLNDDGRRVEAPQSGPAWMRGPVFNLSYGRLFLGGGYARASFEDSEYLASFNKFIKGVSVDISEFDLALGYSITKWFSPYIAYWQHRQETGQFCSSCVATVEIGNVGAGLLFNYLLQAPRSAVYLRAAFIQGISMEGGVSYAGIRWPVVWVMGYAYRRVDYPSREVSCGSLCYRDSDVFFGPTVWAHYVFGG